MRRKGSIDNALLPVNNEIIRSMLQRATATSAVDGAARLNPVSRRLQHFQEFRLIEIASGLAPNKLDLLPWQRPGNEDFLALDRRNSAAIVSQVQNICLKGFRARFSFCQLVTGSEYLN